MIKQEQKDEAWEKYEAIKDPALEKCKATTDQALEEYYAKCKKIDEQVEDK